MELADQPRLTPIITRKPTQQDISSMELMDQPPITASTQQEIGSMELADHSPNTATSTLCSMEPSPQSIEETSIQSTSSMELAEQASTYFKKRFL